jgi:multidrug efflux pump subunit AcrB
MNIAELSIRKSVITWVMTFLLIGVGWLSFRNLSMLEDPEFTIKEAVVITSYPGASAAEVEEEVTNVLEKAIQQLGQLEWLESRSARNVSQIKVRVKDKYDKYSLPQVWDELRRKVNDAQRQLPPGAGPSMVNDDFGDVYGVYLAVTGEGYTSKEMYEYAKFLQRELLHATDVKRIELYGVQPEVIYVEMRREKMAELGISQSDIYAALASKNLPVSSGHMTIGQEYLPVNPTGEFRSEKEFGDLLVRGKGSETKSLVYLRDVADIHRGYKEPASTYLRYDGKPAIGLAISTVLGGNVVAMGQSLEERLSELSPMAPLGMDLHTIYMQTDAVSSAIRDFLVNLAESVGIVIVVLLIFMGLRSGLIIGAVLLVTIMGTFIFMDIGSITLERVSLGALVIALGMLVDNAIVVADGMRMKMAQGNDAVTAAKEIIGQVGVPLLGATCIAIAAFAAIGTSPDDTGEYCRTLFFVILISLALSWVTAVTTTPLLCKNFFKTGSKAGEGEEMKAPYDSAFYRLYRKLLSTSIRFRWVAVGVVVGLFVMAIAGFGHVKHLFFPDSTTPMYYVDFWFPEGTHIDETSRLMKEAEAYLSSQEETRDLTTFIGGGQVRFLLTYTPEPNYGSYAQVVIKVDDYRMIPALMQRTQAGLEAMFPQAIVNTRPFILGPGTGGKIQLRINGPDPVVLRQLAQKTEHILLEDPLCKAARNEWRDKIKVIRPQMAEAQARRAGIDRPQLAQAIESAIEGTQVGVYREKDELLPIIARSPETERVDLANLQGIQVWSPAAQTMMPVGQVLTGFETAFEDPYIWRRDRTKMIKLHADSRAGLPSELFARVKPKIEKALGVDVEAKTGKAVSLEQWDAKTIPVKYKDAIPLKDMPGYTIAWGGEAEDSAKAQDGLAGYIPIFFGLMVLLVILLFNSIKKTLIIWLTVPLSIIGVTAGLLLCGQPFGFMSLLGLMSLSGMLIKNAIVLIDQIDLEMTSGKPPFEAVVDSGVSRLIPVSMAALTTILGMLPLVQDAFFASMAVTIMFGLGFATVLTLIFVPVLYSIFYRIEWERR